MGKSILVLIAGRRTSSGNRGHVEILPPLMPAVSQVDLVRGGACGAVGNRSEISRGKAHVQIRTVRAPGAIDRCGVVVQRVVYVRTIRNRVREIGRAHV